MSGSPWDSQRRRNNAGGDRDAWVELQKKTFTRWCNSYLAERGLEIKDLFEDISDGILMLNLLEIIGKESVLAVCNRKYNKKPKMRIHRIENCNLIFEYVHAREVQTVNISSQDIVDTNPKLVLGLLFTIILRFAISEDGKQGLLLWCQKNTRDYADVDVQNFHRSWADGKAFCALVNHFRPDLLDWAAVGEDAAANLEMAFAAAEQAGITRLLDVADITETPKPDEKSLIAQLTLYWQAFASLAQKETLVDAIMKAYGIRRKHDEWINEFETTGAALMSWIEEKTAFYGQPADAATTADVKNCLDDFFTYHREEKPGRKAQLTHVNGLLTQIRTSESNNGRAIYEPAEEIDAHHLSDAWQTLAATEAEYERALLEKYDALRTADFYVAKFGAKVDNITSFFTENLAFFEAGDVGNSVQKCQTLLDRFASYEQQHALYAGMLTACEELSSSISEMHLEQAACVEKMAAINALNEKCTTTAADYKGKLDAQFEEEAKIIAMVKEFNAEGGAFTFMMDECEEAVDEPYLPGSVSSVTEVSKKVVDAKARATDCEGKIKALAELGEKLEATGRDLPMSANWRQLQEDYNHLLERIASREQDLNRALVAEQAKQNAREAFAAAAGDLRAFMTACSAKTSAQEQLARTKADPQQIVEALQAISAEFGSEGASKLAAATEASDRQTSAGVFANTLTSETMPSLDAEYEELGNIIRSVLSDSTAAVAAAETDLKMNAEQAKEARETFDFFDSNKSGALSLKEFTDGAQAIGLVVSEQDLTEKYGSLTANTPGELDFEGFCSFMLDQLKHGSSKEDVIDAFKGIAGGSGTISQDAMTQNFSDADALAWMLERMAVTDQGLDYSSFAEDLFSR
mmetsp:Transcript_16194/g.49479  ORF Transcript_16194/g.49479 Transcript_16194/m.49479 type:complete len:864 (-) Transcript_16194:853-3444(-)|eukprot:CAMPEP_0118859684 /NCGR_PEP_ID=MMETSP1163-20130328/5827_1 /TAXON_ID=124430 /ORGANISM="Phaeomonas parva, Strain CCMP2877" /LENGTH=863 /DNA_ID=CAMNT_0006793309 /DNA_START=238 /DNA_END=2829 /DNA_ORIENTATION=-